MTHLFKRAALATLYITPLSATADENREAIPRYELRLYQDTPTLLWKLECDRPSTIGNCIPNLNELITSGENSQSRQDHQIDLNEFRLLMKPEWRRRAALIKKPVTESEKWATSYVLNALVIALERYFTLFDVNKDGYISAKDDVNQDGSITREDLENYLLRQK